MRPKISRARPGKSPRTHQHPDDKAAEVRTREFLQDDWDRYGVTSPFERNVEISAVFWRASRQVVDLDNLLKHLLDAATGVCWVNDCQVTRYGVIELRLDRDNPRTFLQVRADVNVDRLQRWYSATTGTAMPL
jgi:Holliday junction resolvase RusA-like endonuclease